MKKLRIFLIILGLLILITASYSFGYGAGIIGNYFRPRVGFNLINQDKGRPKDLDFSLFWQVWDEIHQKYVGQVDDEKLVEGAINGLVSGLGDPYSILMKPQKSKSLIY